MESLSDEIKLQVDGKNNKTYTKIYTNNKKRKKYKTIKTKNSKTISC